MKKFAFSIGLFCCLPFLVNAQIDYWQGGIFIGGTAFSGDVNPQASPDPTEIDLSFGFVGRVDVTPKLGFRGSLSYARFKGDDINYPERADRGFRFDTKMFEFLGVAEWEPFASNRYYSNARGGVEMDLLVSPYLFVGAGAGFANLDTDFSGYTGNNPVIEQGIFADRSQGSSKVAFVVPFGLGIKFDISSAFTLGLEFGGRLSFSDYLDGISESAGPDRDDLYFISGLIAYYRFTN